MEGIFFSYARADSDFALRLAKDLRLANANIWIDQLDIKAGDRWDAAVEDALNSAPSVIVILSPESVSSHNVMDEVSYALENEKKLIPVLFKDCKIPFRLRVLQRIDFTQDYQTGLNNLLVSVDIKASHNIGTDTMAEKENQLKEEKEDKRIFEENYNSKGKPESDTKAKSYKYYILAGSIILVAIVIWGILKLGPGNQEELNAWQYANKLNDSSSYANFIHQYPKGSFTEMAKVKMDSISREMALIKFRKIQDSIAKSNKNLTEISKPTKLDAASKKSNDKSNVYPIYRNFAEAFQAVFNNANTNFQNLKGDPFPNNPINFRPKIKITDQSITPSNIFTRNNEWAFRFVAEGSKQDEELSFQEIDATIRSILDKNGVKYAKTIIPFGKSDTPIDSYQYKDNTGYRVEFYRATDGDKFYQEVIIYHGNWK